MVQAVLAMGGNQNANENLYEAMLGNKKETKTDFIRRKYQDLEFVDFPSSEESDYDNLVQELVTCLEKYDKIPFTRFVKLLLYLRVHQLQFILDRKFHFREHEFTLIEVSIQLQLVAHTQQLIWVGKILLYFVINAMLNGNF